MAFTPTNYMNYGMPYESDEERRRREAEAAAQGQPLVPAVPTVEQAGIPAAAQTIGAPVVPEQQAQLAEQQAQPAEQPQRELPPGVELVDGKLRLAAAQPGPGVQVAGPAQLPVQQAQPVEQPKTGLDLFAEAAGDTNKLMQLYNDKNQPAELRRIAGREASRMLDSETRRAEAESQISQMSQGDLEKLLRSKSEEGNWGKRILFGLLGMKNAADAEDAKLGIDARWHSSNVNGNPVLIKLRADGVPMEGYDATTGTALKSKDLIGAAANMAAIKGANVGGQVYRDPATNETLTKVDTQQGPIYYNKAQQRVIPKGEPVPLTAGSDIATQLQITQMRRQQAFVGQTAEARLRAFAETNAERALAGMPPLTPAQMGLNANGELIGQPQPQVPQLQQPPGMAGGAATAPAAQAPAAQAPAAQAPAAQAPATTGGDLKAQRELRATILKDAADVIKQQAAIVGDLVNTENSVKVLQTEKTNFGTILQGQIPGEKAVGRMLRTDDNIRTENVLDTVNKQAAINAKMLGVNPTDRDLQFVTATKPNESWPPDAVADWLRKSANATRRTLDFARQQIQSGGRFIAETPQEQPKTPVRNTTRPTVSRW